MAVIIFFIYVLYILLVQKNLQSKSNNLSLRYITVVNARSKIILLIKSAKIVPQHNLKLNLKMGNLRCM